MYVCLCRITQECAFASCVCLFMLHEIGPNDTGIQWVTEYVDRSTDHLGLNGEGNGLIVAKSRPDSSDRGEKD